MTNLLRKTVSVLGVVSLAACSHSPEKTALSDELKQDLASVGSGDVQLAGGASRRVDVVSLAERGVAPVAAPRAPAVAKAPTAAHGTVAKVASRTTVEAAPAETTRSTDEVAPAEAPQPAPDIVPRSAGRPQAASPQQDVHTSREPRGGWKTPGDIIRNAPFPINP